MAEFDELNKNVNKLISELRNKGNKEEKVDFSSLNDFAESTKGYEQYLKEIQSNTKGIQETVNSFLKNVNTIERKNTEVEAPEAISTVNYGIEEKAFVDYNKEIKRLIEKVAELSLNLADTKSPLNVDGLSGVNIKDDITVNIDSDTLNDELGKISSSLKNLEAPIKLSFESNIEEIKKVIDTFETERSSEIVSVENVTKANNLIKELKANIDMVSVANIGDIDLSILDDISNKLSELKSVSVDVDISSNVDEIQSRLADFSDIDLNMVLNIESILTQVATAQSALGELTSKFGEIKLDASVNVTHNMDDVRSEIEKAVSGITINPNIQFDVADGIKNVLAPQTVTPTITIPNTTIETIETPIANPAPVQQPEQIIDSSLSDMILANTAAIQQLQATISALQPTAQKAPEIAANNPPAKNAIMSTDTGAKQPTMEELMIVLIQSMNNMSNKQTQMLVELKKSNFLKNND
jgi:hypothetical protein